MNENPWGLWWIDDILIWAQKSPGGAFYDIRIQKTGEKGRYLAEVFEAAAKKDNDGR
jgi:hypothetical protein